MNVKQYTLSSLKYGLISGILIVIFAILKSNWFFTGQYPDLYLTLVGASFLGAGLLLSRKFHTKAIDVSLVDSKNHGGNTIGLLSRREMAVLKLVYSEQTNKEIAAALFIELSTVKAHINTIYKKLEVKNRKELRAKYTSDQIIMD